MGLSVRNEIDVYIPGGNRIAPAIISFLPRNRAEGGKLPVPMSSTYRSPRLLLDFLSTTPTATGELTRNRTRRRPSTSVLIFFISFQFWKQLLFLCFFFIIIKLLFVILGPNSYFAHQKLPIVGAYYLFYIGNTKIPFDHYILYHLVSHKLYICIYS